MTVEKLLNVIVLKINEMVATDLYGWCILRRCFHVSSSWLKNHKPQMKGRKQSSQQWLQRQISDPYVKRSRTENYRCRSAFKLLEIDERQGILKPGMRVIDCGAAPGSWSQIAVNKVNSRGLDSSLSRGCVISIDIQHMLNLPGATVLSEMDFTNKANQTRILTLLDGQLVDVILSDMAPNASGVKSLDHDIIIDLCAAVLDFGKEVLTEGGTMLCKIWQGSGQAKLQKDMSDCFQTVKVLKPPASRGDSAEIFLLGKEFKK